MKIQFKRIKIFLSVIWNQIQMRIFYSLWYNKDKTIFVVIFRIFALCDVNSCWIFWRVVYFDFLKNRRFFYFNNFSRLWSFSTIYDYDINNYISDKFSVDKSCVLIKYKCNGLKRRLKFMLRYSGLSIVSIYISTEYKNECICIFTVMSWE